MADFAVEPLTVMVSSRCSDTVPFQRTPQPMSEVRRAIKRALEGIQLGGKSVFRVWIHEDESTLPSDQTSWDRCMSIARRADLVLAVYNGNAGWPGTGRGGHRVGICQAEFQEAFDRCPAKVRSVQFPEIKAKRNSANETFQRYFRKQGVLGAQVSTGEEAIAGAVQAAVAALLDLARAGVGLNSSGAYYSGEALAWTRLDFQARRRITTAALIEFLTQHAKSASSNLPPNTVLYGFGGKDVAFVCDCIPGALSTAAARELVGQPFLKDHQITTALPPNVGGPVHVIACQRGVTESQALRQLGFPDAIVVSAPFGVYVADDVQKIQMVFISNCRDESTTRHHVQRFLMWLDEQGEDRLLAIRAASRRKIANQIAAEQITKRA